MYEIRILIAAENAQMVEAVTRLVQFEHDMQVVGSATTGEQAIQLVGERHPQVVLIGRVPDMSGVEAGKAIVELDITAQVILLAADLDTSLMRQAMKAGIREVLASPPESAALYAAIREAFGHSLKLKIKTGPLVAPPVIAPPSGPLGVVLAVYSGKGGVGCTMLATNLAILLHTKEKPAVLVDADFDFGDAPIYLNLQVQHSIADLLPFDSKADVELLFQVLLQHPSGLRVLAAPFHPLQVEPIPPEDLRCIIDDLRSRFGWVVVDTGSTLDQTTAAILEQADLILSMLSPDIPSIRRTTALYEVLDMGGVSAEKVALVLNMVEKGRGISARDIRENLKREIVAELPYDRAAVLDAINRGEPLVLNGRATPFTKALVDLAARLREMTAVREEREA